MEEPCEQILTALLSSESLPCSGEMLSERLGVSRAQIWKHVNQLRKRGYQIEGAAGDGYRLTALPDRLYPEEIKRGLKTHWLAQEILYLDQTESTNADAARLAREGAPHGATVIAECQTAGKGRLGRQFHSPAYQNLYTSIVLRPQMELSRVSTLLLTAGVAVARTVAEILGSAERVEIKWPNDVLIGGLKTSGVLMELEAEENRIQSAILGIGVNLNADPREFPTEFRARATSLTQEAGARIDRTHFSQLLYSILEEVIDLHCNADFEAVKPQFEDFFRMKGRKIRVASMDGTEIEGRTLGIADQGALELETAPGERVQVLAGDVTICKDEPNQESRSE
jgi:BirA family biotin operon repressor/biotin-[acetyl-CoA-carboxylase] ligase